jgi:hypothetical protein
VLAVLKEREPRYRAIRDRLLARGGVGGPLTPAAAAAAAGGVTARDEVRETAPAAAANGRPTLAPTRTGQPPRPRKKGKRR